MKQLSQEQLQHVIGEDITVTIIWPESGKPTEIHITEDPDLDRWVYINADTGEVIISDIIIPGWGE